MYYYDPEPDQPPVTIEARMGDEPMVIETAGGKVHGRRGSARDPDAILSGSARLIIGVLSGRLDLEEALRQGLQLDGDPGVLTRVRSASAPPRSTGASAPRP